MHAMESETLQPIYGTSRESMTPLTEMTSLICPDVPTMFKLQGNKLQTLQSYWSIDSLSPLLNESRATKLMCACLPKGRTAKNKCTPISTQWRNWLFNWQGPKPRWLFVLQGHSSNPTKKLVMAFDLGLWVLSPTRTTGRLLLLQSRILRHRPALDVYTPATQTT